MKPAAVPRSFYLAGGLIVLFLLLPLVGTLSGTDPDSLRSTLVDAEVLASIGLTFSAAALATGIGLAAGVPLAYLMARRSFPAKAWIAVLVDLPVVIPHTAAGIALLLVFGRQGLLGRWLAPLGIFFTDNVAGIVAAMLFVSLSFLIDASREAFAQIDSQTEESARVDGASPWQVFWHVALPQAWRGILSGALLMWARGISEFGAVVILAYHPKIVPVLVFERFSGFGLAAAQPVALILIVVVLVVFGALRWLARGEEG
jgi:molybdate/tungstate transport system permease protein